MAWNRENLSNCPCKDCEKIGCGAYHSQCEKYKAWRAKIDAMRKEEEKYRKSFDTMSESKKREMWRSKRYQRMKRNQNNAKGT